MIPTGCYEKVAQIRGRRRVRAEPDFGLRAGLRDGFQKSRAPGSARFFARARAQPDVSPIFAYFED